MSIMCKRYALFAGMRYYPDGGWEDFKGLFETIEDAQAFSRDSLNEKDEEFLVYDWGQIVDLLTEKVVFEALVEYKTEWEWEAPEEPKPPLTESEQKEALASFAAFLNNRETVHV